MFKIKKIKPMFTGVITTSKRYVGNMTTSGGIILDTTKMDGDLNPFQIVVAVGDMVKDLKEGDIVKLNFKRYAVAKHKPGGIDNNIQSDQLSVRYEIPMVEMDGQQYLSLQNNDIEFVVTDYEIDEGGLLQ